MASSGSFNTSGYDGRYLTFSWSIKSQDVATNKTVINWSLKGGGDAQYSWYESGNFKVVINGSTVYQSATRIKLYKGTTVASGTATIAHNNDGTKTFSASAEAGIYTVAVNCRGNGSWALTPIPRYPSVTQTLGSMTETTITVKWSSDSVIDYMWYSINDGATWTGIDNADGKSGSYTITGLSANTTYKIKTSLRRKDSQLWANSTTMNIKTYAYPYAVSMPNFTIGNKLTIGLFNPLGRTVTVNIIGADNSQISNDTTNGTTITGYAGDVVVSRLYASIPNSMSGTYKVKVTYGSQVTTKTGGTYTVNANVCSPSIGTVSYKDINTAVTTITENDQNIVRNWSTVEYYATDFETEESATVSTITVTVNGNTYDLPLYAVLGGRTYAEGGNASINSGQDVTATFTITDSRGLTGTKTLTVKMLDWQLPSAIISIMRRNNFYSETDVNVDADYSSVDGKNAITITYKAKKSGTSTYTVTGTLQDNVTSMVTIDNNFAWDFVVTLTDRFGGTTSYNLSVPRGMPIAFFDRLRESVGINCFPNDDRSLEVNGVNLLKTMFFESGDSLTMTNINVLGMLTNSGKVIRFSVVLPKLRTGLTVTCTDMRLNIRHADGGYALDDAFVSGGYDVLSDNTIAVTQASTGMDNTITFQLSKTSSFYGTNNTPQAVTIERMTLEFG